MDRWIDWAPYCDELYGFVPGTNSVSCRTWSFRSLWIRIEEEWTALYTKCLYNNVIRTEMRSSFSLICLLSPFFLYSILFLFDFDFDFGSVFFFCPLSETFTIISIDKWLVPSNTVQDGTTHNNHERYGTLNYGAIQNESWRNRRWFSKGSHQFDYNSTILFCFFFWFCQINAFNALGRVEYLPKENLHLLSGSGQRIEL